MSSPSFKSRLTPSPWLPQDHGLSHGAVKVPASQSRRRLNTRVLTSRQSDKLENGGRSGQYPHLQQWMTFVCCSRMSLERIQSRTRVTIISISADWNVSGHKSQLKDRQLSRAGCFPLPAGGYCCLSSGDDCPPPSRDSSPSS